MITAVVFSAGGLYCAWEVGVWKALRQHVQADVFIGASAGAWNGWALAGGASCEELAEHWLDPKTANLMRWGVHSCGIMQPDAMHAKARELYDRYQPRLPFGLTLVEIPFLRTRLVQTPRIQWQHLAATASIPFCYPPVRIDGKAYVDGGLAGALPMWAAEPMGAHRAIGINALTTWPFRALRQVVRPRRPGPSLKVQVLEPSRPLGTLHDAVVWSRSNIEGWLALGEEDGNRAITSITM